MRESDEEMEQGKEMGHPRVLVVDDENTNRRLFTHLLKKQKYLVDEAESGEVALELIKENAYDLVISDLHMYKVGGLEVLEAAKSKDENTQVLILTGFGSIHSAVKAMKNGAFEYLTKPINKDEFVAKVRSALERRRIHLLLEEQQKKIQEYHRSIQRDLALARRVQDSLVPQNIDNGKLAVGIEYLPMIGLGGDFVDIYDNQNGSVYLTIIDVTGHGIAAALVVNRLCSEVSKLVRDELEPKAVLYHLNRFFFDSLAGTGLFVTVMSLKVDLGASRIVYAGSAHPAALLYRRQKQTLSKLQSQNAIIGFEIAPLERFAQSEMQIEPGDRIIMYTDGIIEAENRHGKPFGLMGLRNSLRQSIHDPVAVTARALVRDVKAYCGEALRDDVLVVVAEKR